MDINAIVKKVREVSNEAGIYGDVWAKDNNTVAVDVEWGDWKHEHIRLDNDVWMAFAFSDDCSIKEFYSVTTEEDGSDTYSATHYYVFEEVNEIEDF